jgi:hypothetical protein
MKNWIGIVLILGLTGCDSANQTNLLTSKKESMISKNYFEYDEMVHYRNPFEESKISDLFKKASQSKLDSLRKAVLLGDTPQNTSDFGFINELEAIGYQKASVSPSKFEAMNHLFSEKHREFGAVAACIHLYRDLLIFKKENQVIGCASICLSCMGQQIIGTSANTENFGQQGDFEKLSQLLKR